MVVMVNLIVRKTAPARRKKNRGFSLVELIIVITIMAILTALLAPQLLRYVEQSREAKDATTMDEMLRACNLVMISEVETVTGTGILWYTSDGKIVNVNEKLAKALSSILGGTCRPNGSWWIVEGLTPLTSKKCTTNKDPLDSRVPVGGQSFYFTKTATDNTVKYRNNPFK